MRLPFSQLCIHFYLQQLIMYTRNNLDNSKRFYNVLDTHTSNGISYFLPLEMHNWLHFLCQIHVLKFYLHKPETHPLLGPLLQFCTLLYKCHKKHMSASLWNHRMKPSQRGILLNHVFENDIREEECLSNKKCSTTTVKKKKEHA